MILDLQNIYKDYQQDKLVVPVLKDVSLQVEEGEYVAVMGPSGSGKTTLMNIIGCLDRPTSGTYLLAGEDVKQCRDREMSDLRLRSIGFVFQSFQLLSRQSALENVALPLSYAGVKKKERRERATQALERVGLGDRVNFKPTQLSGGQKQRVAIARAMVNNPKILLADEPTGALDSKSGEQIMELFSQLNEEGVTIVMITHDSNIAAKAKRIVHIIDGMITEGDGSQSDNRMDIEESGQEASQPEKELDKQEEKTGGEEAEYE
ncbi:ABC transporter ATP-binding protein [Lachnospiraceae bacterium]|nr:ABC transporter ATP-binding protein [Lachnospiraceae bacterium]